MPCTNAAKSPETADRDAPPSQPIRQTLPDCCARAASGHAAAPPMSVMNSRSLMRPSITGLRCVGGAAPHVRLQRLGDMQKKGPSFPGPTVAATQGVECYPCPSRQDHGHHTTRVAASCPVEKGPQMPRAPTHSLYNSTTGSVDFCARAA